MTPEQKKKTIKKLLVSICVVAVLAGALYLVFYLLGWNKITQEEIQAFIESKGTVAPLIYILISFLQVTFVPIPGAITILAGNYVFGMLEAFIYSFIGMTIGAMVAFVLGRLIGRPFVNWVAGDKDTAEHWIQKLKGREKVILFFMFLFPFFPDDLLCSIAGLFKFSTLEFLIMQLITRATSIAGTLLFMSGEVIPYHGWGIVLIVALCLLGIAAFMLSIKYYDKLELLIRKLFVKKEKYNENNKSEK